MQQYDKHKNSGIEWIGEIPSKWDLSKLKYITHCFDGKRAPIEASLRQPGPYPYWGAGNIVDYINNYLFDEEVILLGEDGAPFFDKTRDVAFYVNEKIWVNNHIHILKTNKTVSPQYLVYVLNTVDYTYYINGSILNKLTQSNMNEINVVLPNLDTQQKIAGYLIIKVGQINNIIAKKEKFIELLQQYRQSVITEAITKGLYKNVLMKDSDIDWIGEIPAHWEIKKIKFLFEIVKRLYFAEDRNILSITQKGLKIRDTSSNDGQLAQSYEGYQLVNVNDFAMNSMDLLTGFVDCSKFEGVTSPDYRVFRFHPTKIQNYQYYKYLFQLCYHNKVFYGYGQGVSNLGRWRLQTDVFKNFFILMPPIEEQNEIASYIDKKTQEINNVIETTKNQVEKLKEYRQSIISEAVTGKIKIAD